MNDELAIAVKRALMDAASDLGGWIQLGERQRQEVPGPHAPSLDGLEMSRRIRERCLNAIGEIAKAQQASR